MSLPKLPTPVRSMRQLGCLQYSLANRNGQRERHKRYSRVQIVFTGLVYNANLCKFLGAMVGQCYIYLASLQGYLVSRVVNAYQESICCFCHSGSLQRICLILNSRLPIPVASYQCISARADSPLRSIMSANPLRFRHRPRPYRFRRRGNSLIPELVEIVSIPTTSPMILKCMANSHRPLTFGQTPPARAT